MVTEFSADSPTVFFAHPCHNDSLQRRFANREFSGSTLPQIRSNLTELLPPRQEFIESRDDSIALLS